MTEDVLINFYIENNVHSTFEVYIQTLKSTTNLIRYFINSATYEFTVMLYFSFVQMDWFRENGYEEVLRHLRQGLAKCHAVAFENRAAVGKALITPHTVNFIEKLAATFGTGIGENLSSRSENMKINDVKFLHNCTEAF